MHPKMLRDDRVVHLDPAGLPRERHASRVEDDDVVGGYGATTLVR
jgi:hypothetical protein